jgi:hypothetical protein
VTAIAGVTRYDRPAGQVFDLLANPGNEARHDPLILQAWQTTPGTIGPGTRSGRWTTLSGRVGTIDIDREGTTRPRGSLACGRCTARRIG